MLTIRQFIYLTVVFTLCIVIIYPKIQKRCQYDLNLLWTKEVSHSPFVGSPLIADINGDGNLDVVAAPFNGIITVVSAIDGVTLPNTRWPQQQLDTTIHASPLLYDITGDGMDDIMLWTSDGELTFYTYNGELIHNATFQLPAIQVDINWYKKQVSLDRENVHDYILDDPPTDKNVSPNYTAVDPHVLATPVIADLDANGILDEMVIPVSYYFDLEYYSNPLHAENLTLPIDELDKYVVGAVVIFNLTSMQITRTVHLELTQVDAEYPGYVLNSPTVLDLDSNGGELEIVIATSTGNIHAISQHGKSRKGFPIPRDTIHGQVLVADINENGILEIVAMDTSGTVMCYSPEGKLIWETQTQGTSTAGMRLADINQDGRMEIIMAAEEGVIWVIQGSDGGVPNKWPFKIGGKIRTVPIVTKVLPQDETDVVFHSEDEYLHIVSGDRVCRLSLRIGETSLTSMLSYDMIPQAPGLELLLASRDGTLLCLGQTWDGQVHKEDWRKSVLDGYPSSMPTHNQFMYAHSKRGIIIPRYDNHILDVTGSWMVLTFNLIDELPPIHIPKAYTVHVYLGSQLVGTGKYSQPGTYTLEIEAPAQPSKAHLKITMTNLHGQVYQDSLTVRFNMLFLRDLQWLLLCPFVAMAVILLLLHGYPSADLLPITLDSKGR